MNILREIQEIETHLKMKMGEDYEPLKTKVWKQEEFYELIRNSEFKNAFPEEVLNKKFRELLKPFNFKNNRKNIYCRLYKKYEMETEGKRTQIYLFSALTQEMLNVDKAYFETERGLDFSVFDILYKPYFYEMSISVADEFLDIKENAWYDIPITKNSYKDSQEDNKKQQGLPGILCFGASPYSFQEITVDWEKKVNANIVDLISQSDINPISDADAGNELDKVFCGVLKSSIKVQRVGQANCISGWNTKSSGEKIEFAFDLGYPINKNLQDGNEKWITDKQKLGMLDSSAIERQILPELVIISHWHQDHYKAAFAVKRDVYIGQQAAVWIAPLYCIQNKDWSADRLVFYLMKNKKIKFLSNGYIYKKDGYALYNIMRDEFMKDKTNENGILLQLNRTLLPGDCDCTFWPPDFGKKISFEIVNVIVPHHGSEYKDKSITETKLKAIFCNPKEAIICVGYNQYGHPKARTVNLYKQIGFNIIETGREKNNIYIDDK